MLIEYAKAAPVLAAIADFLADERLGYVPPEIVTAIVDGAEVAQLFTTANLHSITRPLTLLAEAILVAEVDGDPGLAEDLRHARARMAKHVARRIVEVVTGEPTQLERQLRASLKAVPAEAKAVAP